MVELAAQAKLVKQRLDALIDVNADVVFSSNWAEHDARMAAIEDPARAFYLRTDPNTGKLEDSQIWPDFEAARYNLGCWPMLLRPLVEFLAQQTQTLETLRPAMPAQVESDFDNWLARLGVYAAVTEVPDPKKPSKVCWERAASPLLAGYYPADFADKGIQNPDVMTRPDIGVPTTMLFQLALTVEDEGQPFWTDAMQQIFEGIGLGFGGSAIQTDWMNLWSKWIRPAVPGFVLGAAGVTFKQTAEAIADDVGEGIVNASKGLGKGVMWAALVGGGLGLLYLTRK